MIHALISPSVAELSEKPLYRVTCGDIGTNPEAVEKVFIALYGCPLTRS
jgi:hypothetical protein